MPVYVAQFGGGGAVVQPPQGDMVVCSSRFLVSTFLYFCLERFSCFDTTADTGRN